VVLGVGIGGVDGAATVLLASLAGSLDKSAMFLALDATGPPRSVASLLSGMSVAGLPFTAGFLFKVTIYRAALDGPGRLAVLATLTASTFFLLAASARYWSRMREGRGRGPASNTGFVLALASVLLGLVAAPVTDVAFRASRTLTGGAP
jgi:formate hydrogenlyase subunit 3/multisubunit Na+/H+ antiporter MnhD subunit